MFVSPPTVVMDLSAGQKDRFVGMDLAKSQGFVGVVAHRITAEQEAFFVGRVCLRLLWLQWTKNSDKTWYGNHVVHERHNVTRWQLEIRTGWLARLTILKTSSQKGYFQAVISMVAQSARLIDDLQFHITKLRTRKKIWKAMKPLKLNGHSTSVVGNLTITPNRNKDSLLLWHASNPHLG